MKWLEAIRKLSAAISGGGFIGLAMNHHWQPDLQAVFLPHETAWRIFMMATGCVMLLFVYFPPKWMVPK